MQGSKGRICSIRKAFSAVKVVWRMNCKPCTLCTMLRPGLDKGIDAEFNCLLCKDSCAAMNSDCHLLMCDLPCFPISFQAVQIDNYCYCCQVSKALLPAGELHDKQTALRQWQMHTSICKAALAKALHSEFTKITWPLGTCCGSVTLPITLMNLENTVNGQVLYFETLPQFSCTIGSCEVMFWPGL